MSENMPPAHRIAQAATEGLRGPALCRTIIFGCFSRLVVECLDAVHAGAPQPAHSALREALWTLSETGTWEPAMQVLRDAVAFMEVPLHEAEPETVATFGAALERFNYALAQHALMAVGIERGESEMERLSMALGFAIVPFSASNLPAAVH